MDEERLPGVHTFCLKLSTSLTSRAFSSSSLNWYCLLTSAAPSTTDSFFRVSSSSSCVFLRLAWNQERERGATEEVRGSGDGRAGPVRSPAHLDFILLFLQGTDLGLQVLFLHDEMSTCLVLFLLQDLLLQDVFLKVLRDLLDFLLHVRHVVLCFAEFLEQIVVLPLQVVQFLC